MPAIQLQYVHAPLISGIVGTNVQLFLNPDHNTHLGSEIYYDNTSGQMQLSNYGFYDIQISANISVPQQRPYEVHLLVNALNTNQTLIDAYIDITGSTSPWAFSANVSGFRSVYLPNEKLVLVLTQTDQSQTLSISELSFSVRRIA
jgi:hypothetical protein